ncbi:MAG: hypothetical protein ACTSPI_12300 [Candidatus Heimdallarchaeaceae archaeon]
MINPKDYNLSPKYQKSCFPQFEKVIAETPKNKSFRKSSHVCGLNPNKKSSEVRE